MSNIENSIERTADYWAQVFNRYTNQYICDIAVVDDMGFLYDEDGFIGEVFTIENSGICSRRTRENISPLVNLDVDEIKVVLAQ